MAEACLVTRRHYLDISGEIPGFEALAKLDDDAKRADIMLLPGAGFDVVPTDCLAMHLKKRLLSATHCSSTSGACAAAFRAGQPARPSRTCTAAA
jgi:short subunit dehydrogenase-like uncharacterized protein